MRTKKNKHKAGVVNFNPLNDTFSGSAQHFFWVILEKLHIFRVICEREQL